MFVSMEVITMIGSAVAVIIALVSTCGWLISRMDVRFAQADAKMDARFEAQDAKMDARFEAQDAKMDARFEAQDAKIDRRFSAQDTRFDRIENRLDGVERELAEVKISIARLEGPPPRLISSR
jgi:hypothetical protein